MTKAHFVLDLNNFMPNDFTIVQEAKGIPEERDLAPAEALRL